jgi:hypothetical protein
VKNRLVPAVLVAAAVAIPGSALASGKPETPGQAKTQGQSGQTHGKSNKCKAHKVAYVVSGTLTSYDLNQSAGAQTPDTSDDRYSGTLGLTVTKTNHHAKALSGAQSVTLTDVRVSFGDGVVGQAPAAGTRVKLIGKVTKVSKKCTDQSAAGQVTYRKVTLKAAEPTTPVAPAQQKND